MFHVLLLLHFVFDLNFFKHSREILGLMWWSRFNLHIYGQWSRLDAQRGAWVWFSSSEKKSFETISGSAFHAYYAYWLCNLQMQNGYLTCENSESMRNRPSHNLMDISTFKILHIEYRGVITWYDDMHWYKELHSR